MMTATSASDLMMMVMLVQHVTIMMIYGDSDPNQFCQHTEGRSVWVIVIPINFVNILKGGQFGELTEGGVGKLHPFSIQNWTKILISPSKTPIFPQKTSKNCTKTLISPAKTSIFSQKTFIFPIKLDPNMDFSIKIGPKLVNFHQNWTIYPSKPWPKWLKNMGKHMKTPVKLSKLEALEITSSNFLGSSMDFHFAAQTIQLAKPWRCRQAAGTSSKPELQETNSSSALKGPELPVSLVLFRGPGGPVHRPNKPPNIVLF